MSLLDALLKVDAAAADQRQEEPYHSKRLAKVLGEPGTVEITLREIPAKRCKQLIGMQYDKKGNFDFERNMRAQAHLIVEGVADPNLKDPALREHFGCETPPELAEKLFGMECTAISDRILALSGYDTGEDEEEQEELKNF